MRKKIFLFIISFILCMGHPLSVLATPISDLQKQKAQNQQKLNEVNEQIEELKEESKGITEEIEILDDQMVEIIASVSLLEDEIKEVEAQIEITKGEYEAAKQKEEEQYAAMKKRIQYMYEKGDASYLSLLLGASGISDVLNRAEYIEKLYAYDEKILEEYVKAKEAAETKKTQLEEQQAELETNRYELQEEQKALDVLLEEKRAQQEDFETKLAKAKQQAATYKANIKKQNNEIKKLEEQARKAAEEAAKNQSGNGNDNSSGSGKDDGKGSGNDDGSSVISDSAGSATGKEIAAYACKFVGNPYVSGGTSLTNGADCSGFTMSVYKAFGYNIPRTSSAQRSAGRGVTYAEAQPGDIICYAGHVAIYLGGGRIVHASTPATGIKYGSATYRQILAVRRIV